MKKKAILLGGILLLCLAAVIIFILWQTKASDTEKSQDKTTDKWSVEFSDAEEKLNFLAEYLNMPSEIIDAEYHIVYHDNSQGLVPGPSDWDIRAALKINPDNIALWTEGFEPASPEEIDFAWWEGISFAGISLDGAKAEYYRRDNSFVYLVVFAQEGIILKAMSTTPYIPQKNDELETTGGLLLEAVISDGLPVINFNIKKTGEEQDRRGETEYRYKVNVFCLERPEIISQVFYITSCEDLNVATVTFADVDFDWYLDMAITYAGAGAANMTVQYYRWNVFEGNSYGQFEETPFFSTLASGYELYQDTKQIVIHRRISAASHSRDLYQITELTDGRWLGTYELARTEIEYAEESADGIIYNVRIEREGNEVYAQRMTKKEYEGSKLQRDNFLHFGVGEAIDSEEARALLLSKYGTTAKVVEAGAEREYPLSYSFENMRIINGISYYSFSMSWLVDNNRWSFVDNIYVAPDGTILLSDGTVFTE